MPRCTTCGTESEASVTVCPQCGSALAGAPGATEPAPPVPGYLPPAPPLPTGYGVAGQMPPPPTGGFAPPGYGQPGGYGVSGPYAPNGALADWGTRALGFLIDFVMLFAVLIVSVVLGRISVALLLLGYLAFLALSIWFSVQVGQTGQSPGMRVMGLRCVGAQTGQPIGGGLGFLRSLVHVVDSLICYVGWLFPLWDQRRQTLADKIMGTVVVVVPKQGFSLAPPRA